VAQAPFESWHGDFRIIVYRHVIRKDYSDQHGYRDYGIGAQILMDLGVREMRLLTSSTNRLSALEGFGLTVVSRHPLVDV